MSARDNFGLKIAKIGKVKCWNAFGFERDKVWGETRGGQEEQSIDQYETQTRGADIDIPAGVECMFSN